MAIKRPPILLLSVVAILSCDHPPGGAATEPVAPSASPVRMAAVKDRVTGAGSSDGVGGGFTFTVSAQSGAAGENPRGKLEGAFGGSTISGKVTCLAVITNRAWIGIEHPDATGGGFFLVVVDHGPPGSAIPDQATFFATTTPADEAGCTLFSREVLPTPSIDGDVEVTDAIR